MQEFGPVQILIVGFDDFRRNGEILAELDKLRDRDIIRLLDLLVVEKDPSGDVTSIGLSDVSRERAEEFGALIAVLMGLGQGEDDLEAGAMAAEAAVMADGSLFDDETRWAIADAIPLGTTAAVALIEHRWAIPLRDAIGRAGGIPLADTWIHPEDLIAVASRERKAS